MAFVDAPVNLARVMVAVAAKSLSPPMLTSAALRATVFAAAVLTLWTFLCVPGQNFTHFAPRRNVDKEDRKTCRELIGMVERKRHPF